MSFQHTSKMTYGHVLAYDLYLQFNKHDLNCVLLKHDFANW